MGDIRALAINFEAIKVALRQNKDGVVLTLAIHPNDMKHELWEHPIGSRYMVALVRLGDDDQPIETSLPAQGVVSRLSTARQPATVAAGQEKPRAKSPQQKARERCVILCGEPAFQDWLARRHSGKTAASVDTADLVRLHLGCASRRDIATDPIVYERWMKLDGEYRDHERYGERP